MQSPFVLKFTFGAYTTSRYTSGLICYHIPFGISKLQGLGLRHLICREDFMNGHKNLRPGW